MHAPFLPSPLSTHRIEALAIGASAGGVQAVGALLESLPLDFGAAVLVVLHLPPGSRSALASVFGFRCKLPIAEAEDKESIAPGRVYIAPADYHLLVEPGRTLSLSGDPPVNYSRPSIDVLFESAALAYRDRLLGVILTGANGDGAEGLRMVRACGGLAWVQDPKSALADAMPAAAIAQAGADLILPLPGLVQHLEELARDMRRS
jgi:two-component system chemotaxis response regulator CheB